MGWQKTKEGPSVEETLQTILEQILQHPVILQAASRTDAGVHAFGQEVNFFTSRDSINLDRLGISLNQLLPSDIAVRLVHEMPENFHPTLDCISKEYHYWVCYSSYQLPQHRRYSWHVHSPLDLDAMRKGAKLLTGQHDFSSFTNFKKNERYESHVRCVESIEIVTSEEQRLQFIIKGSHFLYKMVRNLVGTSVDVGKGKLQVDSLVDLLNQKDRTAAGVTAPAHGLTLYKINFNN